MHDAREVANFLLDRADERGILLTNMEVIKHIYFAHGWLLVAKDTPLIKNRIEAWQYGPVIRSVYDCFKEFGSLPITSRATVTDWSTGEIFTAVGDFSDEIYNFLESSLLYYSGYRAFALSEMTHAQGGPWDKVWNARDGRVRMNMEITNNMIREHFAHGVKVASRQ